MRARSGIALAGLMLAASVPAVRAQSAARLERVRVGISAGGESPSITFAGLTTKVVSLESAPITTTYRVGIGQLVDGGVGLRVAGRFGVGVAVSSFLKRQGAEVAAAIPHPFFYNTPRSIEGTAGSRREELVAHIQATWLVSLGRRLDVVLSGGPSLFRVKHALVSDVAYAESYPYDTATFSTASTQTVRASATGFNVGADTSVRLSRRVGVGGLVRFSRASIELPSADATTKVTSNAGGLQLAGGLRLFF